MFNCHAWLLEGIFFLLNFSRSFGAFGCPGVVILGNLSNGCFNPIMGNTWEFLSLNSWLQQNRPLVKPPCVSCKDHGILRTFQSKKTKSTHHSLAFVQFWITVHTPIYIILYPPMAHASQSFIIEKEWVESRTWPSHTKSIHPMVTQLPCLAAPMGQIPPDPVVPPRSPQGYLRAGHPLLGPIHPGESRKRMVKKHVGPMLILTMKSMKRLIDLFCCLGIQTSTPKKQSGTQKKNMAQKW